MLAATASWSGLQAEDRTTASLDRRGERREGPNQALQKDDKRLHQRGAPEQGMPRRPLFFSLSRPSLGLLTLVYAPGQSPISVSPFGPVCLDAHSILVIAGYSLIESAHLFGGGAWSSYYDGGPGFLPFSQLRSAWPAAEHAVPPSSGPRYSLAFKLMGEWGYVLGPEGQTARDLIDRFEEEFPSINNSARAGGGG